MAAYRVARRFELVAAARLTPVFGRKARHGMSEEAVNSLKPLPRRVDTDGARTGAPANTRPDWVELVLCLVAFAVLCIFALSTAPQPSFELDDHTYQASIIALSHGHLTLSDPQYLAVLTQMEHTDRRLFTFIPEWRLTDHGNWISPKDPGYPFLALPFYELGILRLAPLFYGLLGCLGLFFGARRWLGRRFAGAAAVALYCSSGAAALFAWRDYMPTFTDASLLAAGSGAILWAVLAAEAGRRHRTAVGLLGFLALEAAVFTRYTDIITLGVAILAVIATERWKAVRLPGTALWWWLGSAVAFGAGLAAFNDLIYGSPTSTGYPPGTITFSLTAVWPNLQLWSRFLAEDMPTVILALAAGVWITVRYVRSRRRGEADDGRDLAVGAALALSWLGIWGLYLTYTWTAELPVTHAGVGHAMSAAGVEGIRFYVPALGAMALLGAWVLVRLPRWLVLTAVVVLYGVGHWSFTEMTTLHLRARVHL
jgi:hypothetical protein